jgi:two-component system, cell cycle response regulator DivK
MTKVMIVDDLEVVRRMLIYALEDEYMIIQASNGLEAVELAEAELPEVIVMDLDMPVMDGIEATRRIKSNPQLSHIKVLAISAQESNDKSSLVRDDCDAFIEKPFEIADLVETVRLLAKVEDEGKRGKEGEGDRLD